MILLYLTFLATQLLAQEQQKQQLEACIFLTRSFLQKRSTQINQLLLQYNEEQRPQAQKRLQVTLAQLCSQEIEQTDIETLYKSDPKKLNLDEFVHLFEDYHIPHLISGHNLQLMDEEKEIQKIFEWYEKQNELALEAQKKNNDKVKQQQDQNKDDPNEDFEDVEYIPTRRQKGTPKEKEQEKKINIDQAQVDKDNLEEDTDIFDNVYVNSIIGIAFGVFFDYFFSNSIKDFLKTIFSRKKIDEQAEQQEANIQKKKTQTK